MTYINSYKGQDWLLPTSIKQMISDKHICFFVEEFVDSLDFANFDMIYDGAGHPAGSWHRGFRCRQCAARGPEPGANPAATGTDWAGRPAGSARCPTG